MPADNSNNQYSLVENNEYENNDIAEELIRENRGIYP